MATLLVLLGVVPMANLVTMGPGLPWLVTAVREWVAGTTAVVLVAIVLARLAPARIDALRTSARKIILAPSPVLFAGAIGTAAVALALYFGWNLFHWRPVTGDEFSQRWQAHLLSLGRLYARSEVHPEFFGTIEELDHGGRWFSQFPVGGPALLAMGTIVGAPWILNPILSGISTIALYRFAAVAIDELTGRIAAMILLLSPFFLFMGGSEMNHTATLACVGTALASLAAWSSRAEGGKAVRSAALLGASLGVAATIRPFDAAIASVAIGIFQLHVIMKRVDLRRSLVVQLIAGLVPVIALLLVNRATVGRFIGFGYDALNGAEHRPGFHLTPLGFVHTPRRGLYMVSAYLLKLDAGMMGWAVPVVLLVAVTLYLQRSESRWDRLLLGILAMMLAGYAAYWSESYFLGPRFLFTALPVFAIYLARFTGVLRERLREGVVRRAVSLLVPLWIIAAWVIPAADGRISGVWSLARVYRAKGSEAVTLDADARKNVPARALVFVDDGWHARLAARLRAGGMRPLIAEQVVSSMDACTIQAALDDAERSDDAGTIAPRAMAIVARDAPAAPVPGLSTADQLAFVPGRALSEQCQRELRRSSGGVTIAELLPFEPIDSLGRLDGPIVYARDFGPRDELLRARFGDRPWFVAHRREYGGRVEFRFVPYQPVR